MERLLGAGAMGSVFLARDPLSSEPVAIKVLHERDPELLARFAREASVMALHDAFEALSSHQVLMALFGNALCPQDGIACEAALGDLLRGAGQFLEAAPAVSPAGSGES